MYLHHSMHYKSNQHFKFKFFKKTKTTSMTAKTATAATTTTTLTTHTRNFHYNTNILIGILYNVAIILHSNTFKIRRTHWIINRRCFYFYFCSLRQFFYSHFLVPFYSIRLHAHLTSYDVYFVVCSRISFCLVLKSEI